MTCNCTLHPRKTHTDPCRACHSKHVQTPEQRVSEVRGVPLVPAPRAAQAAGKRT